jgi:hypothetical protein
MKGVGGNYIAASGERARKRGGAGVRFRGAAMKRAKPLLDPLAMGA